MTESEKTTIAVRSNTRDRINAQRRLLDDGAPETADEILTRLLDELDGLRADKGRTNSRAAKAPA